MAKFFTYSLLAAAMGLSLNAFAQDAENVKLFSFTVSRSAIESTVSLGISSSDSQSVVVDWGDGTLSAPTSTGNYDDTWNYTQVSGAIAGATITVYGSNAATINALDLSWAQSSGVDAKIKSLDVNALTGLKRLELNTNDISSLDVSKNELLELLYASNNQLSSLTFGNNAVLATVDVSNTFDTTKGKLADGAGNNQVLRADWGSLPALKSLKVSGNTYLEWFGTFDVSKNKELTTLEMNGCEQDAIDVTHMTKLKTFNGQWNGFTTLDLSHMVAAGATINVQNNKLTEIKLPEIVGTKMTRVSLQNNLFTFATLPLPGITKNANSYVYSPQAIVKTPLTTDNKVDFSAFAKVGETPSTFKWMQGENEVPASDYEVADGVFTFKKDMENIYCEITNSVFPNLTMTTSTVTSMGALLQKPIVVMAVQTAEMDPDREMSISMGTSSSVEEDVYVDWGNGEPAHVTLTEDNSSFSGKPLGSIVKIYGNPEIMTMFECGGSHDWTTGKERGSMITNIDLSALVNLQELNLKENLLTALDLSANKKLTKLDLRSNKLTAFDYDLPELAELNLGNEGQNGVKKYGENSFTSIEFSKLPKLDILYINYVGYALDFTKIPNIKEVRAMGNGLTSIDLSQNTDLTYLSLSYNDLTSVDALSIKNKDKDNKASIYLQYNKLTSLKVNEGIGSLVIDNNNLTFATLPNVEKVAGYCVYSPQNPMEVTSAYGRVDLASQAKVGETATEYIWMKGEAAVTTGIKAKDGVFTFSESGDYVCKMNNAACPDLTLSTVPVKVDVSNRHELFSFTVAPAAAGKTMSLNISSTDNQSVVVDWGDGNLSAPVATKNYVDTWEYGTPTGVVAGENITVYGANAANINKLDLSWSKDAGVETKMLTVNLSALTGVDDVTLASNALTTLDITRNTSLAKLFINGNNITDIKFAANCVLTRLEAQNTADAGENNLFKVDLSKAPLLNYLVMSFNNKNAEATTIDLSKNVELATVIATDCNLETLDVSKLTKLSQLTINNNNLETLDVSQMPATGRVFAMNNKISSLVLPAKLDRLNVSNNKLTFATLPATTIAKTYVYNNQKPMVVEAKDGKVDLASQAKVGDVETVFAWTADSEEFTDFTVAAGVFTFTKSAKNAVCTMTNAALPALTLTTVPVNVEADGSAVTEIEGAESEEEAVYYNLQGVKVSGNEPGVYIRRQGNKTTKVIVK